MCIGEGSSSYGVNTHVNFVGHCSVASDGAIILLVQVLFPPLPTRSSLGSVPWESEGKPSCVCPPLPMTECVNITHAGSAFSATGAQHLEF